MDDNSPAMPIGDSDPALDAASLALGGQARRHASRFASIELRGVTPQRERLAPLGYFASAAAGLAVVVALWLL